MFFLKCTDKVNRILSYWRVFSNVKMFHNWCRNIWYLDVSYSSPQNSCVISLNPEQFVPGALYRQEKWYLDHFTPRTFVSHLKLVLATETDFSVSVNRGFDSNLKPVVWVLANRFSVYRRFDKLKTGYSMKSILAKNDLAKTFLQKL